MATRLYRPFGVLMEGRGVKAWKTIGGFGCNHHRIHTHSPGENNAIKTARRPDNLARRGA